MRARKGRTLFSSLYTGTTTEIIGGSSLRLSAARSDKLESSCPCIFVKHSDGLQGVLVQIFAEQRQLGNQVGRSSYDIAAALPRLHYVENFARARPQQLRIGPGVYQLGRGLHHRHRIDAGVSDAPGEKRNEQARVAAGRADDGFDLIEREDRRHVQ